MVEFRVLGPVELWHAGKQVEIGATRQRDLLALLLARPGTPVDRDWLIDALWDGAPPPAARTTLQSCVYRLRKVFEAHADVTLSTRGSSYLLEIPPDSVDARRFDQLAEQGLQTMAISPSAAVPQLRAAMALWRGEAFGNVTLHAIRDHARRLDERRLDLVEQCLAVELELGHTTAVLGELKALAAAHPLRERPAELLMKAQYRAGRRADALATYQQLFRRLDRELGVRPSQSARELHQRILASAPDLDSASVAPSFDAPLPRQLPGGIGDFVGRTDSLGRLDKLLDGDSDRVVLATISGPPGVGKTTLAVHWARLVMHRFPDGQLYTNLRGFDPSGQVMDPSEVVRGFLAAMRVPPERIPADVDAQIGLYRSLLAGKRMLIVLDNARDAGQVRSLLPGSGAAGSVALVTSRSSLTGLVAAESAQAIVLEPFETGDAWQLLTSRLGEDRIAAEPDAAAAVLSHCAGLPLAVAIVAARATAHPTFPLESVAADLRLSRGLDAFASNDANADVRSVFSWSYGRLSPAAARLFRLLGAHPGPDVGLAAIASLAGLTPSETLRLMVELCDAQLANEIVAGRYRLHDLLRTYAGELSEAADSADERDASVARLLDHYLQAGIAAASLSAPYGWSPAFRDPVPSVVAERFETLGDAMTWFDRERQTLQRMVEYAVRLGRVRAACELAWHLGKFFDRRGRWHDYVELQAVLLDEAELFGELDLLAFEHAAYGRALGRVDLNDEGRWHLERAYELCGKVGDLVGQSRCRRALGWIAEREADVRTAFEETKHAVELSRLAAESPLTVASTAELLSALGWCYALLGEYRSALDCCRQAVPVLQQHQYQDAEAHAWDTMGHAHHQLGQFSEALACYDRALLMLRRLGDAFAQADTLVRIGLTHVAAGMPAKADLARKEALDILDGLDGSDAERLRTKLRGLSKAS